MIREAEPRAFLATLADSLDRRWESVAITAAGPWAGSFRTAGGVHRNFEISVVLTGAGPIVVNERSIIVRPGDVLLCDMSLAQRHDLPGLRLRYVTFTLTDAPLAKAVRSLLRSVEPPVRPPPRVADVSADLVAELEVLEHELRWRRPLGSLAAKSALLSFLVLLARRMEPAAGDLPLADRVSAYLQEHLPERVSLTGLAREFGLTPRHLNARFRRRTGTTVLQHLIDLRVERARQLLLRTASSVTEVALETGFCDCQHFCRVFRARAGCTPTQWRRNAEASGRPAFA